MSSSDQDPQEPGAARGETAPANPYATPEAPVGRPPLFTGWRWLWAQASHYGFMVGVGLPASFALPVVGHRIAHGQWQPARGCIPLLMAIWIPSWILCGLAASFLWALGASAFWPLQDVKELIRGRSRIPIYAKLFDRAIDWLASRRRDS